MGDWILLLFSAHGGRFAKRPYFRRRNPSYLFFIQFHFPRSVLQKYKIIKKGWQAECKIL